jgi:hypothetical protein
MVPFDNYRQLWPREFQTEPLGKKCRPALARKSSLYCIALGAPPLLTADLLGCRGSTLPGL